MQVPWRAAEAMHWQLGEAEMARRAGVVPFSLASAGADAPPPLQPHGHHRASPSRGHSHSQSQGSLPRDMAGMPSPRYGRGPGPGPAHTPAPASSIPPPLPAGRSLAARREGVPPRHLGHHQDPHDGGHGYGHPGPGLAPIQTMGHGRGGLLPSVAELTTGVSPYSTPAVSVGVASASPVHSGTASPGPLLPSLGSYPPLEPIGAKRRASPDMHHRETSRRRHLDPRADPGGPSGSRRSA
jgi:hypothetical protein